jgi:small subunit ribosomal protein S3
MGQKIHPLGLRIGITQKHRSNWFAKVNDYPRLLLEDKLLRSYILNKYATTNISQLNIARSKTTQNLQTQQIIDLVEVSIHTATPGKILDRANTQKKITELKLELEKLCQPHRTKHNLPEIRVILNIFKVNNVYSEASVLADFLIQQLEQRVPFRSALKKTLNRTRLAKLKGIKIQISGRLNGAEIARTEWVRKGRVPLQTLRADIDYSYKVAKTIYGILGIKVWTFKGEKN